MKSALRVLLSVALMSVFAASQSPNATIAGRVLDPNNALIADAKVDVINLLTNIHSTGQTNREGSFVIPNLPPGPYRIEISKLGFKTAIREDVVLRVQDVIALNFTLPIGSVTENVTVTGGAPLVNTQDASVSTIVDRNFAENLPMNGRSFQTLIDLTPGVVTVSSNSKDGGQFSVNGQRAASNYWMVDGVSANIGIGVNSNGNVGNGLGGALGSFSAQGGTNSLVSVDALQEFRIQTSTYSPEFGRTPGAQISIVTRSGTNRFHGSAFDFLRNDALDANDWFANHNGLKKPEERQNDFGGVLGGPIIRDKTFFFFSYEGLRLRLPQTAITQVPDLHARQTALPALQPYFNAFPMPNGSDNASTGIAQFNASFSNPSSLDAYSLRIDHHLSDKLTLFGRYNYSPSSNAQRGVTSDSLNTTFTTTINTQTATTGATWILNDSAVNDFRFNYSKTDATGHYTMDSFGGAVPLASLPFPGSLSSQNSLFNYRITALQRGQYHTGFAEQNQQNQINITDNLSLHEGSHTIKVGADFRRLSPQFNPETYLQLAFFANVPSAENGNLSSNEAATNVDSTFLLHNLGIYAQDTWRVLPQLTLTYGLRWDVDFVPSSGTGAQFAAVTAYNVKDFSQLALAPIGTPPYTTTYGNVAPRLGIAYEVNHSQEMQTVIRGGFGVFYDLATSASGYVLSVGNYPFGGIRSASGGTFPLSPALAAAPAITAPTSQSGVLFAFDPHLQLPYTLEWNGAVEQALGPQQTLSLSYIGAAGRRLIQTLELSPAGPNFKTAGLTGNTASSSYNALQVQFERRLSHGLQALASYTWSHSIDSASSGSFGNKSDLGAPALGANANRGASDFDIRNAFSAGLTYLLPSARINAIANSILNGWSVDNVIQARSAPPVDLSDSKFSNINGAFVSIRPDLVQSQPLYLLGSQYPGGKAFNPAAFTDPPSQSGVPLREGNVPRNYLRGFGAAQWDLAIHRDFPIHELLRLQLRAEMFNVLNHPNFGQPSGTFGSGGFGTSSQMLGRSLDNSNQGSGSFSPLYQIGGPRSLQMALKFFF